MFLRSLYLSVIQFTRSLNIRSLVPLLDQAVISGTTFVLMALLARGLGPKEFGLYVVASSFVLLGNSFHTALFAQPHHALGAQLEGKSYRKYTTATARTQFVFSAIVGFVVMTTGSFLAYRGSDIGGLVLISGVAGVCWQNQEFLRRVLYTQANYISALRMDTIGYLAQLVLVILFWKFDSLTGVTAMGALGASFAIGSLMGIRELHPVWTPVVPSDMASSIRDNWRFGNWLVGSTAASWISGQLYLILIAGFVGTAATGGLRVAQNLVAPSHVLTRAIDTVLPSKAVRGLRINGNAGLVATIRKSALPVMMVIVLFFGFVSLFSRPLISLLFGPEYRPYAWLVWVICLGYFLEFCVMIGTVVLRAAGRTQVIFAASALSGVVTLTLGIWMVRELALVGAAIGLVANVLIQNLIVWFFVGRFLNESRGK